MLSNSSPINWKLLQLQSNVEEDYYLYSCLKQEHKNLYNLLQSLVQLHKNYLIQLIYQLQQVVRECIRI